MASACWHTGKVGSTFKPAIGLEVSREPEWLQCAQEREFIVRRDRPDTLHCGRPRPSAKGQQRVGC